jgi:PAS domain S-box-containing protein
VDEPSTAAQRHLRRVIDTAGDAYVAVDNDSVVTDWNATATALFGWTRDEALGRHLVDLIIPPELADAHTTSFDRYRSTGVASILGRVVEVSARRRDGSVFPVEITVWEVTEDDDRGFHAFVRDISERKEAEGRLRRSNEDLQAFAAMAAHDLRSPLAVISMYADLVSEELEAGDLDPALAAEQLHRIRRAADRGVALIEDLLAYASIGQESLEIGAVDLTLLVSAVGAEHQAAAGREVLVEVHELPEVEGSLPLLRQLVSNLLGNAVKYTPADRTVRIVVDSVPGRTDDRVTVRMTDNGDPIPAADRERLFGMFQRGRHSEVPGSGVGLAICQRVAEAHGGRIYLDPDHVEGNRFCVELAASRSAPTR